LKGTVYMHTPAASPRWRRGRTLMTGAAVIAALTLGTLSPATAMALGETPPTSPAQETSWTSTMTIDGTTFQAGDRLDIDYTTDTPDPENWIGLYRVGETPGATDITSAVWDYAPGDSGTVSLNLAGLDAEEWV